jgi:glucosamine--fructose-6-phosphate aminotransferase (isomerizing)
VHVDSAELLHFGMPLLRRDTLLVAVSQSGESAEVVRLANEAADLQGSPFILAVTNGGGSLSRSCDAWLDTRVGDETGPSTMTFTGSLVLLYLVALILADILALPQPRSADVDANLAGSLGAVHRDASGAADAAQSLLGRTSLIEELGEWLSDRRSFVLLGRGSSRAAAEMGALTIKEAAGFPAESLQTAQFRHGPLELAGPDLAAMVIATEPKTRDLDVGLAEDLAGFGAAVALVTEDPSHDIPGVFTIGIEPTATPLSPAVSVIPAQLLAWRLAIAGGREPGSFMRASKVTTRE